MTHVPFPSRFHSNSALSGGHPCLRLRLRFRLRSRRRSRGYCWCWLVSCLCHIGTCSSHGEPNHFHNEKRREAKRSKAKQNTRACRKSKQTGHEDSSLLLRSIDIIIISICNINHHHHQNHSFNHSIIQSFIEIIVVVVVVIVSCVSEHARVGMNHHFMISSSFHDFTIMLQCPRQPVLLVEGFIDNNR